MGCGIPLPPFASETFDPSRFTQTVMSVIEILQQFGATLLGMLIPERKSKVWLAIQWGIIVLIAIAMWAFVRLASH
jgi:hypothetical protein